MPTCPKCYKETPRHWTGYCVECLEAYKPPSALTGHLTPADRDPALRRARALRTIAERMAADSERLLTLAAEIETEATP